MLTPVILACLTGAGVAAPTDLSRKFAEGEKWQYAVHAHLQVESRTSGTDTWLPDDEDLDYKFTTVVRKLMAGGVAEVHYLRPSMKMTQGETFDKPQSVNEQKLGLDYVFRLSPANEFLDVKDQTKRKPAEKSDDEKEGELLIGSSLRRSQEISLGGFIQDLYRLAVVAGSVDSGIDLAPRLAFDPVAVGDSWKRTVSYQPQTLAGKKEMAVQRLDYTYTYLGPMESAGKQIERVEGVLKLNTDLVAFAKQLLPDQATPISKFPLRLEAKIEFDLDPKTRRTIRATAESRGGFEVWAPGRDVPAYEVKLHGETTMKSAALAGEATPPKRKRG